MATAKKTTKKKAGSGATKASPKATRGPSLKKAGWVMKTKTGYYVKASVKGRKRTKNASKSHVGKPRSAATIKKIRIAMKNVWRTGKTKSGRKTLLTKKGKKPAITQAAVLDKGRAKHKKALEELRAAKKAAPAKKPATTRKTTKKKPAATKKTTSKKPAIKR